MNRAREELGMPLAEFELAVQMGEIATVRDAGGRPRVPAAEVARVRQADGGTDALRERLRLVSTTSGAELLGISRERLLRLTKAGRVRPARWYVNRYRAVVWLYFAGELREFAVGNPALLAGRLPGELRTAADAGEDLRPRGWRTREVARLLRDAPGPWEEAAVWAALLGPEVIADAVPDPYERSRLRTIRPELPHGRPGPLADAALIRRMTTADDPEEIATALLALSDALSRARAAAPLARPAPLRPFPGATFPEGHDGASSSAPAASPDVVPGTEGAPAHERVSASGAGEGPRQDVRRSARVPRPRSRPLAAPAPLPHAAPTAASAPDEESAGLRLVAGGVRAAPGARRAGGPPAGPPPGARRPGRAPLGAGAPPGRALSSLRRLLRKGRQLSRG